MNSLKRKFVVSRKAFQVNHYGGFTLVELMITVAILAVLAAVAIPAYSNYLNRAKQSDAIIGLKAAQMAEEQYYSENGAYSSTINLLPGFADSNNKKYYTDKNLTTSTDSTEKKLYVKGKDYYYLKVASANTTSFKIEAKRWFKGADTIDCWSINETNIEPVNESNGIKGYSVFGWLFD